MRSLLIIGPDSTLLDVHSLALQVHPQRRVERLSVPALDYYHFDLTALDAYSSEEWNVCIAVNEFYINDVRRAFHEAVAARGYRGESLVSPRAHVDASASIGKNTVIYAGSFVGAGCVVGHHCVLRPNVVLGEESVFGNYVTLEANVSVREKCRIGDFVTICANCSLMRMTSVGEHCYLNVPRQYSGAIPAATFYSPMFENPVRVLSG